MIVMPEALGLKLIGDLRITPVWVNADHMVDSAVILMRGHHLRAIVVMDGGALSGVLTLEAALGASGNTPVSAVMRRNPPIVSPKLSVPKAAHLFVDDDVDVAVVMDHERVYGVLTANMLLRELRRSWDPLTGLGWSDRLREWGIENLSAGREITLLFIDLDEFGRYNKLFGHLVGDRVLKKVAQMLQDNTDRQLDLLVRYGGDEFAIGSLRPRAEAEALAVQLREGNVAMFVGDAYQPVTFSVGLAGGRRSQIRPDVHVASTYDELVNLASRDALAKKAAKRTAPSGPTA